ncbi:hypothetical protein [Endozoicomonas sp.]|uniref:hypothetical protein n=1 Tax=Endozoicomonas sp. TaxID=1892382 RepID=UPI003AF66260
MRLEQKASTQSPAAPKEQPPQDQKKSTTGGSKPAGPVKTKGQEIVQRAKTDPAHSSQSEEKLVTDRKTKEQVPTPENKIREALSELSPNLAPHRAANLLLSRNGITTTAEEIQRIRSGNSSTAQQQSVSKPQKTSKAPGKQSKVDGENEAAERLRKQHQKSENSVKQSITDLIKKSSEYKAGASLEGNITRFAQSLSDKMSRTLDAAEKLPISEEEFQKLSAGVDFEGANNGGKKMFGDLDLNEGNMGLNAMGGSEKAKKEHKVKSKQEVLAGADSAGLRSDVANTRTDKVLQVWARENDIPLRESGYLDTLTARGQYDRYTLEQVFSGKAVPSLLELMLHYEGISFAPGKKPEAKKVEAMLVSLRKNIIETKQKMELRGEKPSTLDAVIAYTKSNGYHPKGFLPLVCQFVDKEDLLGDFVTYVTSGKTRQSPEFDALRRCDELGFPSGPAGLNILAHKIYNTFTINRDKPAFAGRKFNAVLMDKSIWISDNEFDRIYASLSRLGEEGFTPENICLMLRGERPKLENDNIGHGFDEKMTPEELVEALKKEVANKDIQLKMYKDQSAANARRAATAEKRVRELEVTLDEMRNQAKQAPAPEASSNSDKPKPPPPPAPPPPKF